MEYQNCSLARLQYFQYAQHHNSEPHWLSISLFSSRHHLYIVNEFASTVIHCVNQFMWVSTNRRHNKKLHSHHFAARLAANCWASTSSGAARSDATGRHEGQSLRVCVGPSTWVVHLVTVHLWIASAVARHRGWSAAAMLSVHGILQNENFQASTELDVQRLHHDGCYLQPLCHGNHLQ